MQQFIVVHTGDVYHIAKQHENIPTLYTFFSTPFKSPGDACRWAEKQGIRI